MESVLRGVVVYAFLLAVFRLAGKRTLANITTFDLVLTLIIGNSVQEAMRGRDGSMTNAFLLVLTLVALDVVLSQLKLRSKRLHRIVDGEPVVLWERGVLHRDRMNRERIDMDDLLAAAREKRGVADLEDMEAAVLEESGCISIVAKKEA